MRDLITLLEAAEKPTALEPVELSYSKSGLSPVLSTGLLNLHTKLWHSYSERFNNKQGDQQFNYAGYWLHNIYFRQFRAPRTNNEPNGPVGSLIRSKYKDWDNFRETFKEAALKLQGSGWVYLARDGSIKTIQNHAVRNDILILVDMWEHAFQVDYGTNKAKYLDNIWRIMDWGAINTHWGQAYK